MLCFQAKLNLSRLVERLRQIVVWVKNAFSKLQTGNGQLQANLGVPHFYRPENCELLTDMGVPQSREMRERVGLRAGKPIMLIRCH